MPYQCINPPMRSSTTIAPNAATFCKTAILAFRFSSSNSNSEGCNPGSNDIRCIVVCFLLMHTSWVRQGCKSVKGCKRFLPTGTGSSVLFRSCYYDFSSTIWSKPMHIHVGKNRKRSDNFRKPPSDAAGAGQGQMEAGDLPCKKPRQSKSMRLVSLKVTDRAHHVVSRVRLSPRESRTRARHARPGHRISVVGRGYMR